MKSAKLYEEKIQLDTSRPGMYDPHPKIDSLTPPLKSYPYPYAFQPYDKVKKKEEHFSVCIENEYLKVITLPHMGGRIFSIYDKINKKELIHKSECINIAHLAGTSGGTYAGLGMEICFPDAHAMTNTRKREYSTIEHEDGSKTIIMGEHEFRYGMRWCVHLTLKPGIARLFQKTLVQNHSSFQGRFRYWAIPGVPQDEFLEVIYPESKVWEHGGEFGVMSWPVTDGVDMRFPETIPQTTGFEPKDVRNGFGAYYDHKNNRGMVHWADPGEMKGKKYWSWGSSAHTQHRADYFTDGKKYIEFQSGRNEDQEFFETVNPYSCLEWNECWYPIGNMKTVSDACETLAVGFLQDFKKATKKLDINIQANIKYDAIDIEVRAGDKVIGKGNIKKLSPEKIASTSISLKSSVSRTDDIKIFFMKENYCLLCHKVEKEDHKDLYIERVVDVSEKKIERTTDYLTGKLRDEIHFGPKVKYNADPVVRELIEEVLNKDPGHAEALKILGTGKLEQWKIEEAIKDLHKSVERNLFDPETHYFLGMAYSMQGMLFDAHLEFAEAIKFGWKEQSYFKLAMNSFRAGHAEKALKLMGDAIDFNGKHVKSRLYRAVMLNDKNAKKEALAEVSAAQERFPADPLIPVVKTLIEKSSLKGFNTSAEGKKITVQLRGDIQTYYELVLSLMELEKYSAALEMLDEALKACKNSDGLGMAAYYRWKILSRLGRKKDTEKALKNIRDDSVLYSFPFRFEEYEILKDALAANPKDKFAAYYLGIILASKNRFGEAEEFLEKAVKNGLENKVVYSSLAEIAKQRKDNQKAMEYYEKAIELDKNDVIVRVELAKVYSSLKKSKSLDRLFDHPSALTAKDLVPLYVAHLVKKGEYDKAVDIMENKVKFPHMAQQLYQPYSELMVTRGLSKMKQGKYEEAAKDFKKSLDKRPNFGGKVFMKYYNIKGEFFQGYALWKAGKKADAKKIWAETLKKQEQTTAWRFGGAWAYGLWVDRYYQGWILKLLGHSAEANTYFDALKAWAAHKVNALISEAARRELLKLAYNGLNEDEIIMEVETDTSYLDNE